jgi:hypothetical protein
MIERIIGKIEHIRTLPEHIRLRYMMGMVAVCMIFIIGIWILTIKQGFSNISPEVSNGKDQAGETISNLKDDLPPTDSLRSLKENSDMLRLNEKENNAEDFVNEELERKSTTPDNQEAQ